MCIRDRDVLADAQIAEAVQVDLEGEVLAQIAADAEPVSYTHLDVYKRQVSDHVIFMDGGVIVEQGRPDDVINHPKQERTVQFLSRFN